MTLTGLIASGGPSTAAYCEGGNEVTAPSTGSS